MALRSARRSLRVLHRRERAVFEYKCGLKIEPVALPSTSRISSMDDIINAATSNLFPKGFPDSVGTDYVPYAAWSAVSIACGSAGGVLATQSLLCAVGVGQSTALPLAASLNWVLKDGIGQLGAVVSAAIISDRFDSDPKRWRGVAALAEATARCLNASTPFAPWAFLPIASAANLGYSVACLAASATKADFHRSLARRQNLGDITAKAGSQAIISSLLGTGVALGISAAVVATPTHAFAGCVLFTAGQLLAMERSLQNLALPTLTPAAGAVLLHAHLEGDEIPTPKTYAGMHRVLTAPHMLARSSHLPTQLGSLSLLDLLPSPAALQQARESCEGSNHLLALVHTNEVRVLLLEGATPSDILLALLHAGIAQRELKFSDRSFAPNSVRDWLQEAQDRLPIFTSQLLQSGWDIDSASKLEDSPSRLIFLESGT